MTADHEKIDAQMRAREAQQIEELAEHPNPAVSVWRMLPGNFYGAMLKGSRVVGYTVKTAGKEKFMPADVARRLCRDGKCESPMGGLWITVNPEWSP